MKGEPPGAPLLMAASLPESWVAPAGAGAQSEDGGEGAPPMGYLS